MTTFFEDVNLLYPTRKIIIHAYFGYINGFPFAHPFSPNIVFFIKHIPICSLLMPFPSVA